MKVVIDQVELRRSEEGLICAKLRSGGWRDSCKPIRARGIIRLPTSCRTGNLGLLVAPGLATCPKESAASLGSEPESTRPEFQVGGFDRNGYASALPSNPFSNGRNAITMSHAEPIQGNTSELTLGTMEASAREWAIRVLSRLLGPLFERSLDLSAVRKILILQMQQLGDSVVFTPTLRAIRAKYPDARLDLLCSPVSFELYRKSPYADRLFVLPGAPSKANWRAWWTVMRELRRVQYDVVIADVAQSSLLYGLTAALTGVRQRIGFARENRGFLFTHRLGTQPGQNFIDANLEIARLLRADDSIDTVQCFYDSNDTARAKELLGPESTRRPIIAVHPASNWQSKTWFPERWAVLLDRLQDDYDASIVLVGTAKEREYVQEILARMSRPARSLAGLTSLTELAALLAESDLFVGTDSGPRHIASGVGVRQVTLMSSQDSPDRWVFRREEEIVLRTDPSCSPCFSSYCSHRRCMEEISVARALSACKELLERGRRGSFHGAPSRPLSIQSRSQ